jgi:hypothetical protein
MRTWDLWHTGLRTIGKSSILNFAHLIMQSVRARLSMFTSVVLEGFHWLCFGTSIKAIKRRPSVKLDITRGTFLILYKASLDHSF